MRLRVPMPVSGKVPQVCFAGQADMAGPAQVLQIDKFGAQSRTASSEEAAGQSQSGVCLGVS